MKLGLPFETYIIIFELGVAAAIIAGQTARRDRGSLEMKAINSMSPQRTWWEFVYLAGTMSYFVYIALAFWQFRFLTAIGWLALGAFPTAILYGVWFGSVRPSAGTLIAIWRGSALIASVVSLFLLSQMIGD